MSTIHEPIRGQTGLIPFNGNTYYLIIYFRLYVASVMQKAESP